MPDGILVLDERNKISVANGQMVRMSGYSVEEMKGRPVELLVPQALRTGHKKHHKKMMAGVRAMGHPQRDHRLQRKDGSEFSVAVTLDSVKTEEGWQTVVSVRDISERRMMEADAEARAMHDPLTGLANRALFGERLSQARLNARREGKLVCLAMLDLDSFKAINDAYGHWAGDEVLVQVAGRISEGLRATDTAARLGGDEFAWVLPGVASRHAAELLVHKRMKGLKAKFLVGGREMEVLCSVGLALYPEDGEKEEELMRAADAAMYESKHKGQKAGLD
jgi:diguanylate cyclase (GGDEF)-like protein/PAS domain S-box-containing protein